MNSNNKIVQNLFQHVRKAQGFTLIEMIVVLALIGFLTTIVLLSLDPIGQIQKGDDAHRKGDLETMQHALELYYQDNGVYPANTGTYEIKDGATTIPWGGSWSPYITKLPQDPQAGHQYIYYSGGAHQSYYIYAHLQRGGKDPQSCNAGGPCTSLSGNGIPITKCGGTCNYGVSSSNVSP